MEMRVVFHTRLRLRVWRPTPAEPPGIVPGQDEQSHYVAALAIYDALKWLGNPLMVKEINEGRMKSMGHRLLNSVARTGEAR